MGEARTVPRNIVASKIRVNEDNGGVLHIITVEDDMEKVQGSRSESEIVRKVKLHSEGDNFE
jgi:hypothetical protein